MYYALQSTGNDLFPVLLQQKSMLALATYAALAIELSFPVLAFWRRTRWLALALVGLLQIGIDVLMAIRFFGLVMYLGLLAFVRPSDWLQLRERMARGLLRMSRRGGRVSSAPAAGGNEAGG